MCQTKIIQKLETHFMFKNFFFSKTVPNMRKCGKTMYSQAGHIRQYNTTHAQCMLDIKGYKHTLRIRNTYFFSTATMVALTRLKVRYTCIARLVSLPEGCTCSNNDGKCINIHLISLPCYELSLIHNTTRVSFTLSK